MEHQRPGDGVAPAILVLFFMHAPRRHACLLPVCLGALWLTLVPLRAASSAADQTMDESSRGRANFARADFRLWLPSDIARVRAALVLVPGSNSDGRSAVDEASWRVFATQHDLALVGCYFIDRPHDRDFIEEYVDASRGTGEALLDALQRFARRSDRPELARAPLFLWGMSAGGEFNYEFAAWRPERVIAFVVNKGGIYYSALLPPAARAVPALFFAGSRDLPERVDVIKGLFAVNRRAGAQWALTIEPGIDHAEGRSRELALRFFADVLPRRLGRPGTPLVSLDESSGFLGDPATGAITPAARAASSGTLSAWLPTREFAEAWRAVVLNQPPTASH